MGCDLQFAIIFSDLKKLYPSLPWKGESLCFDVVVVGFLQLALGGREKRTEKKKGKLGNKRKKSKKKKKKKRKVKAHPI